MSTQMSMLLCQRRQCFKATDLVTEYFGHLQRCSYLTFTEFKDGTEDLLISSNYSTFLK